ncbi:hypothetical protein F4804DRAFT_238999 [Jackrogersella minutella]|nr:hypothetical protein F4804DRAFT_238999 [Jackrogersella minutella]
MGTIPRLPACLESISGIVVTELGPILRDEAQLGTELMVKSSGCLDFYVTKYCSFLPWSKFGRNAVFCLIYLFPILQNQQLKRGISMSVSFNSHLYINPYNHDSHQIHLSGPRMVPATLDDFEIVSSDTVLLTSRSNEGARAACCRRIFVHRFGRPCLGSMRNSVQKIRNLPVCMKKNLKEVYRQNSWKHTSASRHSITVHWRRFSSVH